MIFTNFDMQQDVVSGKTTRVASGIWPSNVLSINQNTMVDDFFSLTGSIGNSSYGSSPYDIRRTAYYLNVYPTVNEYNNNDPYFSISYGNFYGEYGSGSYGTDISVSEVFPAKSIYTEYKNLLIGSNATSDQFVMANGTGTVIANDIWVISFSSYKMNDNVDAGTIQFSLSGANGVFTFIDDSPYQSSVQTSYQIISGSLGNLATNAQYQGLGIFYPASGIIVLNASAIANLVGLNVGPWPYSPNISPYDYTINHKTLVESLKSSNQQITVQKSEYVPSSQYYVRVKNQQFNYSNNPTFVYDGTDGIHPQGYIYNSDFITNPKTYITTVGLYNASNELVAVAKLSRPATKSFDNELLFRIQIDT